MHRSARHSSLHRRHCLAVLLCAAVGPAAWAQSAAPLVGVLVATGLQPLDYLRQGLRELGFVEGQSVAFAFRSADGNPRDLHGLARHLASLKPALLFCAGPAAVYAAVHATSSVPIVALDLETDPLRSGLVKSLQRPGTNVTGLFLDQNVFAVRWFELLRQVLPRARNVNLLWEASTGPWQLGAAKAAAARLGFDSEVLVVRDERDFDQELQDGLRRRPEALVLLSSPLVRARSAQVAAFCSANRLPAISPFAEFAQAGGLMAYGPDVRDYYLRAAGLVERILKGTRVEELPLLLPDNFRLVLNLRSADALGVELAPALRAQAAELVP